MRIHLVSYSTTLPFRRIHPRLIKIALFVAMLAAFLGAPATSQAQTITMRSADAHRFADALVQTTVT